MKKGKALKLGDVKHMLSRLVYRFHVVLFVVTVVGGMAVVVFLLNNTITKATDTSQMMQPLPQKFDQETIDRLNQLHTSDSQTDIQFPQGRINPFTE